MPSSFRTINLGAKISLKGQCIVNNVRMGDKSLRRSVATSKATMRMPCQHHLFFSTEVSITLLLPSSSRDFVFVGYKSMLLYFACAAGSERQHQAKTPWVSADLNNSQARKQKAATTIHGAHRAHSRRLPIHLARQWILSMVPVSSSSLSSFSPEYITFPQF